MHKIVCLKALVMYLNICVLKIEFNQLNPERNISSRFYPSISKYLFTGASSSAFNHTASWRNPCVLCVLCIYNPSTVRHSTFFGSNRRSKQVHRSCKRVLSNTSRNISHTLRNFSSLRDNSAFSIAHRAQYLLARNILRFISTPTWR